MSDQELKKELDKLNKLVKRVNSLFVRDTFNLIGTLSTLEEASERIRKTLLIEVLGPEKKE